MRQPSKVCASARRRTLRDAGRAPESMVRVRFCARHESHAAERTPPLNVNGACWQVLCGRHTRPGQGCRAVCKALPACLALSPACRAHGF